MAVNSSDSVINNPFKDPSDRFARLNGKLLQSDPPIVYSSCPLVDYTVIYLLLVSCSCHINNCLDFYFSSASTLCVNSQAHMNPLPHPLAPGRLKQLARDVRCLFCQRLVHWAQDAKNNPVQARSLEQSKIGFIWATKIGSIVLFWETNSTTEVH